MEVIAFPTPSVGYQNQLKGAIGAVADLKGYHIEEERFFLLPENAKSIADVGKEAYYSHFKDYKSFAKFVWQMFDSAIKRDKVVPKVVLIAYDQSESAEPGHHVDMTGRAIKEYYREKKLGNVFVAVISSRFYKYKYIDLINIPKFLLTFYTRLRLFESKKMRRRSLVTVGIINNFKPSVVQSAKADLLLKLKKLSQKQDLAPIVSKLQAFCKAPKRVVFCLGGRVEGNEIIFDLRDAATLAEQVQTLASAGYAVAIVNGPRTPNNVTDYLYKAFKENPQVVFHNCKRIAQNEAEASSWRIYSGDYETDFKLHAQIGNIYPAVVGFENTLVVHTLDTYASCETASAAIPTAVMSNVPYIDKAKRYDCYNLQELLCPKYAADFDRFLSSVDILNLEPKNLKLRVLSNPLRVFAETVVNRMNGFKK